MIGQYGCVKLYHLVKDITINRKDRNDDRDGDKKERCTKKFR